MFLIGGARTVLVRSAIVCPTVLALADHLLVMISIKVQHLSLSFVCHFQYPVQLSNCPSGIIRVMIIMIIITFLLSVHSGTPLSPQRLFWSWHSHRFPTWPDLHLTIKIMMISSRSWYSTWFICNRSCVCVCHMKLFWQVGKKNSKF